MWLGCGVCVLGVCSTVGMECVVGVWERFGMVRVDVWCVCACVCACVMVGRDRVCDVVYGGVSGIC